MERGSFTSAIRKAGYLLAIVLAGVYAFVALRSPSGIPALMEKRHQVRELQEQNATLIKEIQMKRDQIKRLRDSRDEQELEIRRRLKLLRPGETSFIIPEAKPASAPVSGVPETTRSE